MMLHFVCVLLIHTKAVATSCKSGYYLKSGACHPNLDNRNLDGYKLKEGDQYLCICKDETTCNRCIKGIDNVEKADKIESDPGEGVIIKVYSDASISASILSYDHEVRVPSDVTLTLTDVKIIDLSDTTKIKVGSRTSANIFVDGGNVIIQPDIQSPFIQFKLPSDDIGKPFTIDLTDSLEYPLIFESAISTNNFNNAPLIKVIGKGDFHTYDYPFEKIQAAETVYLIKGSYLICNPERDELYGCKLETQNNIKILETGKDVNNINFEKNTVIFFCIDTFESNYLDINISKLSGQKLHIFNYPNGNHKILDDSKKLRVLSTTVLHCVDGQIKLEGSDGSAIINDIYQYKNVIGYDDMIKIVQDEKLNLIKNYYIQAQKKESTIYIDEPFDTSYSIFYITAKEEGSKITVKLNENLKKDDIMKKAYLYFQDNIDEYTFEGGKSSGGGFGTGAIIGVAVAAVVVVAAVIGVVVFLVIRKKKKNADKNSEGENDNL